MLAFFNGEIRVCVFFLFDSKWLVLWDVFEWTDERLVGKKPQTNISDANYTISLFNNES